jgi:hypothetical protein
VVAVGSDDDNLYVINGDGSLAFQVTTGGDVEASPSFCDLDDDGVLEVVAGSEDGMLYVYSLDGTAFSGWPQTLGGEIVSSAAFCDTDDDEEPEIFVGCNDGYLYGFDPDGTALPFFPVPMDGAVESSPAVHDLDRDHDYDVIVGTNAGVAVIDIKDGFDPLVGIGALWRMDRANPYRTGVYDDITINVEEGEIDRPAARTGVFFLGMSRPNPTRGLSTISFAVPEEGKVSLEVYNSAGRKVKTLVSDVLSAGSHAVDWDGRDDLGRKLANGVYFYRLEASTRQASRSMLLLR